VTCPKLRRAVGEAIGFYWGSGLSNDVPALAWFLLASLVPLALGITALAAVVLGDYAKAQMVAERLSQVLPHNVHEQVVQLILRTHRDSPLLILGRSSACSGRPRVPSACWNGASCRWWESRAGESSWESSATSASQRL
jgi:uncharacterized BrkB/YihY/UPF0761 family membrane protein